MRDIKPGKNYRLCNYKKITKVINSQIERGKREKIQDTLLKIIPGMWKEDINTLYTPQKIVGRGSFGTVYLARRKNEKSDKKFAIKLLKRKRVETNLKSLQEELNILFFVEHTNIVKFYEAFLDHRYVHLVMEYCNGGELYERLLQKERFHEQEAKKIIK